MIFIIMVVSFKYFKSDSSFGGGVFTSLWTGFDSLNTLFSSSDFWTAFRNTFILSFYGLIFGFPFPIILALFFSEIKNKVFLSISQVFTYLPKFISLVVITSLIGMEYQTVSTKAQPGLDDINNAIALKVLEHVNFKSDNTDHLYDIVPTTLAFNEAEQTQLTSNFNDLSTCINNTKGKSNVWSNIVMKDIVSAKTGDDTLRIQMAIAALPENGRLVFDEGEYHDNPGLFFARGLCPLRHREITERIFD